MLRIIVLCISLSILAAAFACGGTNSVATTRPGGGSSPTEAYKQLYAAVKSQDTEAIKLQLTKKSVEFGAMAGQRNNKPPAEWYANGFTATTFSETLPEIRDERVKDDMGAVEVWNAKESKWEDLPFINEEGGWRLAVGDLFAGTFKSPGRGLDSLEKEAANAMATPAPRSANNQPINAPIVITNAMPDPPANQKKEK